MATEFNFKRAFDEKYYPLFQKFSIHQQNLFDIVHKLVVEEDKSNIQELIFDKDICFCISKLGIKKIQETALIVYRLGYYCYDREKIPKFQAKGFYWKFQDICDQWLIHNGHKGSRLIESKFCPADEFMDHKVGTSYDNDEITNFLNSKELGEFVSVKVININHRVVDQFNNRIKEIPFHIFMITKKHIKLSSVYIDCSSAPCGTCGKEYKYHKSDTVVAVKFGRTDQPENKEIEETVKKAFEFIEQHNKNNTDKMNIDGFVLAK